MFGQVSGLLVKNTTRRKNHKQNACGSGVKSNKTIKNESISTNKQGKANTRDFSDASTSGITAVENGSDAQKDLTKATQLIKKSFNKSSKNLTSIDTTKTP